MTMHNTKAPNQQSVPAALTLSQAAAQAPDQVLGLLSSGPQGLSSAQAASRLAANGPNVLPSRKVTWVMVLWRQMKSPILLLLVVAAVGNGMVCAHEAREARGKERRPKRTVVPGQIGEPVDRACEACRECTLVVAEDVDRKSFRGQNRRARMGTKVLLEKCRSASRGIRRLPQVKAAELR